MPNDLKTSAIRILDAQGRTAGAGFLVADRLAVTCAHVILSAQGAPGQSIRIQHQLANATVTAQVLRDGWSVLPGGDDVAFLRLEELPAGAEPVILGPTPSAIGHHFVALGYPAGKEVDERWPQGRIGGLVSAAGRSNKLIELDGEAVDQGLSGGAVLDLDGDRVVGMITGYIDLSRPSNAPQVRIAYATSTETLQALCSQPLQLLPVSTLPGSQAVRQRPYNLPLRQNRPGNTPYVSGENWLVWFIQQSYAYFAMGWHGIVTLVGLTVFLRNRWYANLPGIVLGNVIFIVFLLLIRDYVALII